MPMNFSSNALLSLIRMDKGEVVSSKLNGCVWNLLTKKKVMLTSAFRVMVNGTFNTFTL